ncbi:hypothetical protein LC609_30570 [Nostoc sp. XA013]|nr:hypothetical protein [Nostoc sp. XA013]
MRPFFRIYDAHGGTSTFITPQQLHKKYVAAASTIEVMASLSSREAIAVPYERSP